MMFETILRVNLFSSIFENNANGYWYKLSGSIESQPLKLIMVLNYFLIIENVLFC